MYLAFANSRNANSCSSFARWQNSGDFVAGIFSRQAIPMVWDYAEVNVLSTSTQNWMAQITWVTKAIQTLPSCGQTSVALQFDATSITIPHLREVSETQQVLSTDPPYYDNVPYADLSDFFYIWLRFSTRVVYPNLFATLAVPKSEELVAAPYRHGGKEKAESFFLDGMERAMRRLVMQTTLVYPTTVYYAFKQSETKGEGLTSHRMGNFP